MFLESFNSVEFDVYQDFLLSEHDVFATLILETNGQFVMKGTEILPKDEALLRNFLQSNNNSKEIVTNSCQLDEYCNITITPIDQSFVNERLILLIKNNNAIAPASTLTKFLNLVFSNIRDIIVLSNELNDMSDDLVERYEELNLFYGWDEIVDYKDINQGKNALQRLVDDCNSYLSADIVSLSIPTASLYLQTHDLDETFFLQAWNNKLETIKQNLTIMAAGLERPRVVNDIKKSKRLSNGTLAAKYAIAPIRGPNKESLGYLSLVKNQENSDFSNSDRRLLKVVAEQAAAIVSGSYDLLTGFLNRDGMEVLVGNSLHGKTQSNTMLMVDIDQFKMINDTCGRKSGDELLTMVAHLISSIVDSTATKGRIGSDEFCIILHDTDLTDAGVIADEFSHQLRTHGFKAKGLSFELSVSIGIVELNSDIKDPGEAFAYCNIASNIAKRSGRGGIFVYDKNNPLTQSALEVIDWAARIREVLQNDHLLLNMQKIIPLHEKNSTYHHYEVLLRLKPESGIDAASPFQMIKAAENYNMISQIDRWVFKTAMSELQRCKDQYPQLNINFSINLSGKSINDEFFSFLHREFLQAKHLIPNICLEITETAVMSDMNSAVRLIESLKAIGIEFSLDDFGTGMSSFGNLNLLPVDYLKIDGSFVKEIVKDRISYAMVDSIHRIASIMKLKTIAEYVESNEIANALRNIGVDFGQGYGLNKPQALEDQLALLLSGSNASTRASLSLHQKAG